jgi:hypothetical protein
MLNPTPEDLTSNPDSVKQKGKQVIKPFGFRLLEGIKQSILKTLFL